MTMPTAFSVSMLAFGFLTFPAGYNSKPGLQEATQNEIAWGADYLLKLISPQGSGFSLIYQVGNYSDDQNYWGRPEDITFTRPYYATPLNVAGQASSAVDLGGAIAGALLAAHLALPDAPNSAVYLSQGLAVYDAVVQTEITGFPILNYASGNATRTCGLEAASFTVCVGDASQLYTAVTANDFAFWAAAWAYRAGGQAADLLNAQAFQAAYIQYENATGLQPPVIDWGNMYYAANQLIAAVTKDTANTLLTEGFLDQWMCNTKAGVNQVRTTIKGRIYCYSDPSLGATANSAFIAAAYALQIKPTGDPRARLYTCWAQQQIRILMGEAVGRSLVVGVQNMPPQYAAIQSASCPITGSCDATNGLFAQNPNPEIAYGSLVYGNPLDGDAVQNSRPDYSNQAAVEYNAGFQGALAGLAQLDLNWYQCKINYGITDLDQTFCGQLEAETHVPS